MNRGRIVCPQCATENTAGARFCSECGNRLGDAPAAPVGQPAGAAPAHGGRELERKIVTALFCDVVGSTDLAERLDVEVVEHLMSTYHRRARRVIEAHGGTVEKFIGDAVVGIFGAPIAHEDDPTRAVRASLAILRDLAESSLGLQVRLGVQTGEALVRVDPERAPEEGMATGGALNTAARVQNAAPIDGVAVGAGTYRLTAAEFSWEDLGSVALKGIAEPVHIWRPIAVRSSATRSKDDEATPFLGREAELATLRGAFESAVRGKRQELVTVVAEPGLGKSRLVRELRRHVEATAPETVWRVGRCLPYGDGVTFWALGEIIKVHAGVLETDDQPTIEQKLDAVLLEQDPEIRAWQRERLAPLVGLQTDAEPPAQEEAFAAWRRFLESLAAAGPAVIVIEDLHWADAALVDFLLDLAARPASAPILLLVTTRPEIEERHAAWLARGDPARVLRLASLGDEAIAALIGSALGAAAPGLLDTVLERAAGSPLYAEQLGALIRERGGSSGSVLDEGTIPATVQALLAARIDSLPRDVKPALLDASVVGRVFWSGAVARLAGRDVTTVEPALSDLERQAFTRSKHPSTMADEAEYGFWHALLREVAYSFLPRALRLSKHRAAAAWISDKARGTLGDLAEIVVDHLRRAEELAGATGAAGQQGEIRAALASALLAAADHGRRVEPARAIAHFRSALELLSDDDPRRGDALTALGRALIDRAEFVEAAPALTAARAWYQARGDEVAAAEVAVPASMALRVTGQAEAGMRLREEARPILEANPGPGLLELLGMECLTTGVDAEVLIARSDRAMAIADSLGLPHPVSACIGKGIAMFELGDRAGEAEVRRGIEIGYRTGQLRLVMQAYMHLGWGLQDFVTADEALAVQDEALAFARIHGLSDVDVRTNRLDVLEIAGRHDELLEGAAALHELATASGNTYTSFFADLQVALVRATRGEPIAELERAVAAGASLGWPATGTSALAARCALERGEPARARRVIADALDQLTEGSSVLAVVENVLVALELGNGELARRLVARAIPPGPSGRGYLSLLARALVLEHDGAYDGALADYMAAEAYLGARGWAMLHATALAGLGRTLVRIGRVEEGLARLREARDRAEPLRARPFISAVDSQLDLAIANGTP